MMPVKKLGLFKHKHGNPKPVFGSYLDLGADRPTLDSCRE